MALPLTRFTTIINRHLSDAAASHIARHACEVRRRITRAATAGLALPVLDQRRADPGDLLISLGHTRRRIPQINHHNALCFVIRAKQGDNPARVRQAPVLSAINQPAGSTERINGPATRSSTIHCSSCRCERALRRWLVSSLRRVAAMLAGVVVSRRRREAPHSVPFPSGQGG
ncbi:blaSHV-143_1_JQ341060 [Klebsiella pneumoniae]|nr:blaSHV-143_1_JQ341060 [Klebsiella pneumoniae]